VAAPSASLLHSLTDKIAAEMALELAGYNSQLSTATINSLGVLLDGAGDLSLEAALMAYCNAIDDASLPENYYNTLTTIKARECYRGFATALRSYVLSAAGGAYSTWDAYLTAISGSIHPLYAELHRAIAGEGDFTASSDVLNVFAPNMAVRAADKVYTGADGALVDDTTDASDVGTADVPLFASNNHYLYVGSRYKFQQLIAGLSTLASATITPTFAYWNGSSWATLTVTDNSTGFTKNDNLKWTIPADWTRSYKDTALNSLSDLTPLYYIRIKRTNSSGITAPTATGIRIVPKAVYTASGGSLHLGVDQPPLAILRITAASTIVVESIVNVDYTRFKEPAIRVRALTPFSNNITLTPVYTNQAGTAGRTQAQSAFTAPAAYDTQDQTLQSPDTGVRAIDTSGWAASTSETEAVLAVEVVESRVPAL
jgi:hypothetical protein